MTDPEKEWHSFLWLDVWGKYKLFPRTSAALEIMRFLVDFLKILAISY